MTLKLLRLLKQLDYSTKQKSANVNARQRRRKLVARPSSVLRKRKLNAKLLRRRNASKKSASGRKKLLGRRRNGKTEPSASASNEKGKPKSARGKRRKNGLLLRRLNANDWQKRRLRRNESLKRKLRKLGSRSKSVSRSSRLVAKLKPPSESRRLRLLQCSRLNRIGRGPKRKRWNGQLLQSWRKRRQSL